MRNYYIGPWVRYNADSEPYYEDMFAPPQGAIGCLDLAALPVQGVLTTDGRQVGLFVTPADVTLTSEWSLLAQNTDLREENATSLMQDAFESETGYRPSGDKLLDLVWDCLTTGSDPTGDDHVKPLLPGMGGRMLLILGGHSVVKAERFHYGVHGHTSKVRDLMQRDFARIHTALQAEAEENRNLAAGIPSSWQGVHNSNSPIVLRHLDRLLSLEAQGVSITDARSVINTRADRLAVHHERVLDFWCLKYNTEEWRDFVPQAMRSDIRGRRPRETTVSDTFDRTDQTGLGTSSDGDSWTFEFGSTQANILDNQANFRGTSVSYYRNEGSLSGDDMSLTIDYSNLPDGSGTTNRVAIVGVRFDTSAATFYRGNGNGGGNVGIGKVVSGITTLLATDNFGLTFPCSGYMEVDGSSLLHWREDPVNFVSATDTALTGYLRGGLGGQRGNSTSADDIRMDNYVLEDLTAAQSLTPTAIDSVESVNQPTVNRGAVSRTPTAIGSAEAHNTPTLTNVQTRTPSAVGSAEAHNTHTIVTGQSIEATSTPGVPVSPSLDVDGYWSTGSAVFTDDAGLIVSNDTFEYKSFIRMEISIAAGTSIAKAVLEINVSSHSSPGTFDLVVVGVKSTDEAPTSVATADAATTTTASVEHSFDPASETELLLDVTEIVQEIVDTLGAVEGVVFYLTTTTVDEWVTFVSLEFGSGQPTMLMYVGPNLFGEPTITITSDITPTAIGSAEAHQTQTITFGAVTRTPSAIGSAEAHNTQTITVGTLSVTPTPTGSAEAHNTQTITFGGITVTASSTDSAEAHNTQTFDLQLSVTPTATGSAEAHGQPSLSDVLTVVPTAVSSAEDHETQTISVGLLTVVPAATASAEAHEEQSLSSGGVTRTPSAIDSAEAHEEPVLITGQDTIPTAIDSEEDVTTPTVQFGTVSRSPSSIASAEAHEQPTLDLVLTVTPTATASAEAHGTPTRTSIVSRAPTAIGSAEDVRSPTVNRGTLTVVPTAVASAEAHGTTTIVPGVLSVTPTAIGSAEAHQTQTLDLTLLVTATGTPSAEAHESPALTLFLELGVQSTGSAEVVEIPSLISLVSPGPFERPLFYETVVGLF